MGWQNRTVKVNLVQTCDGLRSNRNVVVDTAHVISRDLTIIFSGLDRADMQEVERYLTRFTGYVGHRVSGGRSGVEVDYRTSIGSSHLKRNLFRVMEELGIRGRISQFSGAFRVTTLRIPRSSRRSFSGYSW